MFISENEICSANLSYISQVIYTNEFRFWFSVSDLNSGRQRASRPLDHHHYHAQGKKYFVGE